MTFSSGVLSPVLDNFFLLPRDAVEGDEVVAGAFSARPKAGWTTTLQATGGPAWIRNGSTRNPRGPTVEPTSGYP